MKQTLETLSELRNQEAVVVRIMESTMLQVEQAVIPGEHDQRMVFELERELLGIRLDIKLTAQYLSQTGVIQYQ